MCHGNCKCPHHIVNKVLAALVWVSGILFFWTSLRMTTVWGFESLYYAWAGVVLSLMLFSTKYCGCCGFGKMGTAGDKMDSKTCTHQPDCKCGDCPRCM